MEPYKYSLVVQETDLDAFGHVNNAVYLRYFENARWSSLKEVGLGMNEILHDQIGPVILEVQMTFQKELKAQDQIHIETTVVPFKGKVTHIEQVIKNANQEVCSKADFVVGIFDLKRRKLIEPPEIWKSLAKG